MILLPFEGTSQKRNLHCISKKFNKSFHLEISEKWYIFALDDNKTESGSEERQAGFSNKSDSPMYFLQHNLQPQVQRLCHI